MFSSEVSSLEHRGWRFSSFRGPIATQAELVLLTSELGLQHPAPPLPEETYPSNFIEASCGALTLRIDALGALRRWNACQKRDFPEPSVTSFDWTYSSDYGGSLASPPLASEARETVHAAMSDSKVDAVEGPVGHPLKHPLCWHNVPAGLPVARLLERESILFYSEVTLYSGTCRAVGHGRGTISSDSAHEFQIMPHPPRTGKNADDLHDRGEC